MIGTSAVLHEEISDYYIIPQIPFLLGERVEEITRHTELELLVTDSETGRAISNAMISLDSINRTAVCDDHGRVIIEEIIPGDFILDVIVWGYKASSTTLFLSAWDRNTRHIKMIRNC